jgi:dTDP-4-amino-4,6-dideoxygalactose transaminase
MTDLQAALGLSQMDRVDEFVAARNRIAARYDSLLAALRVDTPWQLPDGVSARHLYVVRLKLKEIRRSHREVFESMRRSGIGVNLHYIPVYRQPYYAKLGASGAGCPEAERYYAEAITLPLYPALTEKQQDRVIEALREACS